MSVQIDLPRELEREQACEAARRGQSLSGYLLAVLGQRRTAAGDAEAVFAGFWRDLPRRSPADLVALAKAQGIQPVTNLDAITGGWLEHDSVDDFLAARHRWQWEGRLSGATPEDFDE